LLTGENPTQGIKNFEMSERDLHITCNKTQEKDGIDGHLLCYSKRIKKTPNLKKPISSHAKISHG